MVAQRRSTNRLAQLVALDEVMDREKRFHLLVTIFSATLAFKLLMWAWFQFCWWYQAGGLK